MKSSELEHNRFPKLGTISLEGGQLETANNSSTKILPTLETDAVLRTLKLTQSYVNGFRPSERNQGQQRSRGEVVGLQGEHGSGKTHAIGFIMTKVSGLDSKTESKTKKKLHFYAKAETAEFLEIYRKLVEPVSLNSLRNLYFSFCSVVASEQLPEYWKEINRDLRSTEKFKIEPKIVYQSFQENLFEAYLIEEGVVQENQEEEIKSIAQENEDFHKVFSYLGSSDMVMSELAYKWFLAKQIDSEDIDKLGVSNSIDSERMAVLALQVLVMLNTRIGNPVIIYIDQIEKLVLDNDSRVIKSKLGSLQSLLEIIPRQNGMLVLSGKKEAWKTFPVDFLQRFSNNIVKFPILTLEEAKQLIKLYLTPPDQPFERECLEKDLKPFTIKAVEQILSYSSGNIRILLQSCFKVYDAFLEKNAEKLGASQFYTFLRDAKSLGLWLVWAMLLQKRDAPEKLTEEKIEPTLVTETLRRGSVSVVDKETVIAEIKKLLREKSLHFNTGSFQKGLSNDFTVLINNQPRLFIVIREAIFYLDEVEKSLEHLTFIQNLPKLESQVLIVLVVLGYVSPEVTKAVRNFVDEFIVYKSDTFSKSFGELLERISVTPQLIEKKETNPQYLEELKSELTELKQSRQEEFHILESRFNQLMTQQATERHAKEREEAKRIWTEKRHVLEDKIRETRAERQKKELVELEHLRAEGESSYGVQAFWRSGFIGIMVLIVVWLFGFSTLILNPYLYYYLGRFLFDERRSAGEIFFSYGWVFALIISVIVVFTIIIIELDIFGSFQQQALKKSVVSFNDIDRIARAFVRHKWKNFDRKRGSFGLLYLLLNSLLNSRFSTTTKLLRNPNPQVRYAGVLAASRFKYFELLLTQFSSERSSLVRRLIAEQIAENWNENIIDLLYDFPEIVHLPETVYIVEESARRELIPEKWMWDLPTPLITLIALSGGATRITKLIQIIKDQSIPRSLVLEFVLAQRAKVLSIQFSYPTNELFYLTDAFESGLYRWLLRYTKIGYNPLSELLSESQVRVAIKELSPFEEGGLGTYDELHNIHKINQYYLFFCELCFLMEQDLI